MSPDTQSPIHPFGPLLEADEPLLWLVRPNSDAFRAQRAKVYLFAFGFSAAVFLANAWPFKSLASAGYTAFALITALTGAIWASRTAHNDEEWSVTWYALTPRRLLKQSLDTDSEGGRCFAQAALIDLHRLRLRKRYVGLSMTVGTITCYTSARFVREHLTLDCVEDPDAVLVLIEEARAKIAANSGEAKVKGERNP